MRSFGVALAVAAFACGSPGGSQAATKPAEAKSGNSFDRAVRLCLRAHSDWSNVEVSDVARFAGPFVDGKPHKLSPGTRVTAIVEFGHSATTGLVVRIDTETAEERDNDDPNASKTFRWEDDCRLHCSFAPGPLPETREHYELPEQLDPDSGSKRPPVDGWSRNCN